MVNQHKEAQNPQKCSFCPGTRNLPPGEKSEIPTHNSLLRGSISPLEKRDFNQKQISKNRYACPWVCFLCNCFKGSKVERTIAFAPVERIMRIFEGGAKDCRIFTFPTKHKSCHTTLHLQVRGFYLPVHAFALQGWEKQGQHSCEHIKARTESADKRARNSEWRIACALTIHHECVELFRHLPVNLLGEPFHLLAK